MRDDSHRSLERVKALGGGIAIQDRMAFQGEYFLDRYGRKAAERTPPVRKMLELGIPVGAGTDATRVASYNPWLSLYWLVSGNTLGGASLYTGANRLSREKPCGSTRRAAVGSRVRAARRAPSRSGGSRMWPPSRRITFPCRTKR